MLKLGGELLETPGRLATVAESVVDAARAVPLIVAHGGGREIDASLAGAGIPKRQVDGLRITDEATLAVVVSVLAGSINTRFVAAINAAGGQAVGLTGADAGVGPVEPMPPYRTVAGDVVSLERVGQPIVDGTPFLLGHLLEGRYLPVVASIGAARDGALYNVNADTLAAALAARTGASRLVIAGASNGVLDASGRTIPALDPAAESTLVRRGTINAGMLAKLHACRAALAAGVRDVIIINGSDPRRLAEAAGGADGAGVDATRIVP
ncbi:MAG: acetylglutamate kinase [Acidobacteriota bacterium]